MCVCVCICVFACMCARLCVFVYVLLRFAITSFNLPLCLPESSTADITLGVSVTLHDLPSKRVRDRGAERVSASDVEGDVGAWWPFDERLLGLSFSAFLSRGRLSLGCHRFPIAVNMGPLSWPKSMNDSGHSGIRNPKLLVFGRSIFIAMNLDIILYRWCKSLW